MKRRRGSDRRPERVCAVSGCGAAVGRGSLLCDPHFTRTPHDLRQQMLQARRDGPFREWIKAGDRAAAWHRDHSPGALAARMLGERDEPATEEATHG